MRTADLLSLLSYYGNTCTTTAPPATTTQVGITLVHCLPGAGMIETEAECYAAAAALNAPVAGGAGSEWASGCLFHGGQVYYSTHDDASTQNPTDAYVCNAVVAAGR